MQSPIGDADYIARYPDIENHGTAAGQKLVNPGSDFLQSSGGTATAAEYPADSTKFGTGNYRQFGIKAFGFELV